MLVSPISGILLSSLTPTLVWQESSPAAQRYQAQIATTSLFTSVIWDKNEAISSQPPDGATLQPGMRYYWRVRAFNSGDVPSDWSATSDFRTPLQSPLLRIPQAAQKLKTDRPAFDWTDVDGATRYQFQVSTALNFKTTLLDVTATNSSYQTLRDLPQNKVLYWRVRASSPDVTGPWSAARKFTSGNPPSVPALLSPANNSVVRNSMPTLDWSNSSVPFGVTFSRYQIQVSTQRNFSTLVVNRNQKGIASSSYKFGAKLSPNTTYYWRVRSFSAQGHFSAWSKVFTFRTASFSSDLSAPGDARSPNPREEIPILPPRVKPI